MGDRAADGRQIETRWASWTRPGRFDEQAELLLDMAAAAAAAACASLRCAAMHAVVLALGVILA
uniref:Uncharacterized protein n=1 Tax=Oryza brachyantha TaxID=4533 RepID=J3NCZ1_ORYBR